MNPQKEERKKYQKRKKKNLLLRLHFILMQHDKTNQGCPVIRTAPTGSIDR